jgi:hypothetical protein
VAKILPFAELFFFSGYEIFAEDIGKNKLGLEIHLEEGNSINFTTPTTIMVGET